METQAWKIEWNDGMSVGIPEIDEDHKRFIFLVDEFNRSITSRMDPAEIKKKLQFIIDDAAQHFRHEERLLKEWQYPDVGEHASIHAQAMKVLQGVKGTFIPYGHDAEWTNAGLMIKGILINHILTADMKYADYYRNSRDAKALEDCKAMLE